MNDPISPENSGTLGAFPPSIDPATAELIEDIFTHLDKASATHVHTIVSAPADLAEWPEWCDQNLRDFLVHNQGISSLWSHQRAAADAAWQGQDVILATGTSSGKSLAYLLPILSRLAAEKQATALYLTPTKALGADQLLTLSRWLQEIQDPSEFPARAEEYPGNLEDNCPETHTNNKTKKSYSNSAGSPRTNQAASQEAPTHQPTSHPTSAAQRQESLQNLRSIQPAPYDGDTPSEARPGIRDHSRFIFSNPDMLHGGILSNHQRWARFLRHLRFIVIDECHSYRGIFGAHVALVIRRLLRLAAHYGAHPVIIAASATSADPGEHFHMLIGHRPQLPRVITTDGSPHGPRTLLLWEPAPFLDDAGEPMPDKRRAASTEAAEIMGVVVAAGARTLSFVRSRHQAELTALGCQETLSSLGRSDLVERIAAYRAGYLAEDRRQLEHDLDSGALLGVATTNALELGIDIGGLDVVITAGFPGTIASLRQQGGRAGRRGQGALVIFIARNEPLDSYLVHHPEVLVDRPVERIIFDPTNPYVLRGHLLCAALEQPLSQTEINELGAAQVAEELQADGLLRKRPRGWFATLQPGQVDPHQVVNLRGGSGNEVMIVDAEDGRVLGTVDAARAGSQVHPGAVYLHRGETFLIQELDLDACVALAQPASPEYSTMARTRTDIRIMSEPVAGKSLFNPSPGLWVASVDVEVTTQVVDYQLRMPDGTVLETVPLDLPAQQLMTKAVAYTIDPAALKAMGIAAADIPGTLHAAEHAAIGMLPLIATCDRWDIGGVSTAEHADTGLPTVFVYDGHPGGAGFADCGFREFAHWIATTFEAVRSCPCESGCPLCVQSPKCGNANHPLDKQGAITLLGAMTSMLGAEL